MIGAGVHLYMCLCVCVNDPQKSLNGSLAVDSPFSNIRGRLLVEFID